MSDSRRIADNTLPIRIRQLFGSRGIVPRLMIALDRGRTSVEDIVAGRNVPPEIAWIVEILECTPLKFWPARWQVARGADASEIGPIRKINQSVQRGNLRRLKATAKWSEVQALIDAHRMSKSAIARHLGVTRSAVSHLVRRGWLKFTD